MNPRTLWLGCALGAPLWGVIALVALALTGCASEPQVRTVEVMAPVPVPCPAPPATTRPALALADLTPDSPPQTVLRAYAATVERLMGYAAELERILSGYE